MILVIFGLLSASLILGLVRLVRGPSLPDRAVALDLIAITSLGFIGAYAVMAEQAVYLDVAMVLALIAFFGTTAFAHYIEKGGVPWKRS